MQAAMQQVGVGGECAGGHAAGGAGGEARRGKMYVGRTGMPATWMI